MSQPAQFQGPIPSGSVQHYRVATGSGAAVLLLSGSQEQRSYATIFNHSSSTLYIMFGQQPSAVSWDEKVLSGSVFNLPSPPYQGQIYGILDAGAGVAMMLDVGLSPD